ncbi:hypothetical protein KIPB_012227, partial [Kipferlia bialata]|eukprot:g12227.t1
MPVLQSTLIPSSLEPESKRGSMDAQKEGERAQSQAVLGPRNCYGCISMGENKAMLLGHTDGKLSNFTATLSTEGVLSTEPLK